jgi:hypothetical protein
MGSKNAEAQARWRAKHPELARERRRECERKNPAAVIARRHRLMNDPVAREKKRLRDARWRKANRDEINAVRREWYRNRVADE